MSYIPQTKVLWVFPLEAVSSDHPFYCVCFGTMLVKFLLGTKVVTGHFPEKKIWGLGMGADAMGWKDVPSDYAFPLLLFCRGK